MESGGGEEINLSSRQSQKITAEMQMNEWLVVKGWRVEVPDPGHEARRQMADGRSGAYQRMSR
jgi:hypothetical protein